jgi:hypothetical protein
MPRRNRNASGRTGDRKKIPKQLARRARKEARASVARPETFSGTGYTGAT